MVTVLESSYFPLAPLFTITGRDEPTSVVCGLGRYHATRLDDFRNA